MDPRDGHRQCPPCLGVAHVVEDIENPCVAALDLPLEVRVQRAKAMEQPECAEVPSSSPAAGGRPGLREGRKRVRKRSPEVEQRHNTTTVAKKRRVGGTRPQEKAHQDILAAIQGLSERIGKMEAQQVDPGSSSNALSEASQEELPSHQVESVEKSDVLSLFAQGSLLESSRQTEQGGHTSSLSEAGSIQDATENQGAVATKVLSTVLSAAKIVGLSMPAEAQAPEQGVWAGISRAQPVVSVPAAADYLLMLRKSWNSPTAPPQFNPGGRRLTKDQFGPDSGLSDMPPVERGMAALTSLGPSRVTDNPRCPVKECHKTDTLVCRSYNAAARAARSGNALAILLAAIRKSVSPEDHDTMSLVDSALIAHSQLTRDVGMAMSSAVLARRQVWLAQTSLPEGIRRDLSKMPVVPGKVFHPDSQHLFESAEQSRRTRESVRRTFSSVRGPVRQPRGSRPPPQQSWPRPTERRQSVGYNAPRDARPPRRQATHQQRPLSRARPQRQCPPRATGPRGNNP